MTFVAPTPEAAVSALFDLLTGITVWKTTSRRFIPPADISFEMCPALIFDESDPQGEEYIEQGVGIPPIHIKRVKVLVYTHAGVNKAAAVVPATILNNLLQSVRTAIMAKTTDGQFDTQTLGGVCYNCWIKGKVPTVPGDLDGLGLAIVPVEILLP